MTINLYQTFAILILLTLITACAPTSQENAQGSPTLETVMPTSSLDAPASPSPEPTATQTPDEQFVENTEEEGSTVMEANLMNIQIGDTVITATLADNSSVEALKSTLTQGPVTIKMRDYGSMEKVGPLGFNLPRNDHQITTEAGDIILYQGNALVIYYAPNSWNFTRLGKINDVTASELLEILGTGDVTITLSLP